MEVHCTLFRRLAQIHYGQTEAPFSTLLRSPGSVSLTLYVPSLIRSRFRPIPPCKSIPHQQKSGHQAAFPPSNL